MSVDFTYDNRTGRGPGRFLRVAGVFLPGIRSVQRQVVPYAEAWAAHNRAALARPGRRWIVLGDSMSQGIGASAYDAGWVNQVHDRLGPGAPIVINLSATGARVPDVLAQQVPAYRSLPAPTEGPDLVTVLIGSNDLFAGKLHRERLPEAFAELLRLLPERSVVATLPQPRGAAAEANAHIDRAAAGGAVHVVDLRTTGPTSWRGLLAADRFHPNDAGYAAIADAFEPVVRAAYGLR